MKVLAGITEADLPSETTLTDDDIASIRSDLDKIRSNLDNMDDHDDGGRYTTTASDVRKLCIGLQRLLSREVGVKIRLGSDLLNDQTFLEESAVMLDDGDYIDFPFRGVAKTLPHIDKALISRNLNLVIAHSGYRCRISDFNHYGNTLFVDVSVAKKESYE